MTQQAQERVSRAYPLSFSDLCVSAESACSDGEIEVSQRRKRRSTSSRSKEGELRLILDCEALFCVFLQVQPILTERLKNHHGSEARA